MTEREALKLALEALEKSMYPQQTQLKAIAAIKEALAQPEQEPVVWMYQDKSTHQVSFQKHMRAFVDHGATYETPLYTTPPQRTWVELNWDDLPEIYVGDIAFLHGAKWAEAKLREKNSL